MKKVTVVGAGFAGLTVAYELAQLGFQVTVHERQERPGGLLYTHRTAYGLVETAANALLCNLEIENLFEELGLKFATRKAARKKRYIYWNKPSRWPLTLSASARVLLQGLRLSLGQEDLLPIAGESISEWARRFAGGEFEQRLLAPGLQGIYAGNPEDMSAVLILKTLFADRAPKGKLKGSVSPQGGMGALTKALAKAIEEHGGEILYDSLYAIPEYITEPTVIATSAWNAADLLKPVKPALAAHLETCESLPLVSATCFFEPSAKDLQGFGCLFPAQQKFKTLGVLFNDSIFEERSRVRSETWILGGARALDITARTDDQILEAILSDRKKMNGSAATPVDYKFTRWNRAIPHYTLAWERTLLALHAEPPLYLHGNYLGELGLSRIFSRSKRLAKQLKESHG